MVGDHVSGMFHGISKWVGFHLISFNSFFGNLWPTVQAWKNEHLSWIVSGKELELF